MGVRKLNVRVNCFFDNLMKMVSMIFGLDGTLVEIRFRVADRSYRVYGPTSSLLVDVKDILLNREYEHFGLALEDLRGRCVIDAGAHVGLFSIIVSNFARTVVAIEPHPIAVKLLEINKMINNCQNIVILNTALVGKSARNVKMFGSSSFMATAFYTSSYEFRVPAITLKEVIEGHAVNDELVSLKIDVEGQEFDIFEGIDSKTLERIYEITGEIHLEQGDPKLIFEKLRSMGFQIWYCYPPIEPQISDKRVVIKIEGPLIRVKLLRVLTIVLFILSKVLNFKETRLLIFYARRAAGRTP